MESKLGIIGGTGFYDLVGLEEHQYISLPTPFGITSDDYIIGKKNDQEVVFIPRHGRHHSILPGNINYRANIWGLKSLGVTHVIAISAVGSFKEEIKPGSIVFIDQYFDRTKDHQHDSFFDEGVVAHISFGDPICSCIHDQLVKIADDLDIDYCATGTYVNIQGPAFSTRVESQLYRSWGMSVVGMTNLHEARLCREAELHYATIAQVTDYDSWRGEAVDVSAIMANLAKSTESAGKVVSRYIEKFPFAGCHCDCHRALENSILSDINHLDSKLYEKYQLLLNKYFG